MSGGGIQGDNTWKQAIKDNWRFLFPTDAMAIVYRGKFLQALQQMIDKGEITLHKVAISNHRIRSINEDGTVTFEYKDYADEGSRKQMTLTAHEFIRRFEQHILPARFTKRRTYGYLGNRNRQQRINEVLNKMTLPLHKSPVKIPMQIRMMEQFGIDITECPCCKNKTLKLVKIFYPWKQADDG